MKTKSLVLGLLLVVTLSFICLYVYKTNKESYEIISVFLYGIIGGVIAVLYSGFSTPSVWLFKYRFWLDGFLFGIGLFLFSTFTNKTDNTILEIEDIIRKMLVGTAVGILIFGSAQYWIYKSIKKTTPFQIVEGEVEIIASAATINNEDIAEAGRMILTSKRLCFVSSKNSKLILENSLTDSPQNIQITYRMGIANGIFIPANATNIHVRFSWFWLKQINKASTKALIIS